MKADSCCAGQQTENISVVAKILLSVISAIIKILVLGKLHDNHYNYLILQMREFYGWYLPR